MNDIHLKVITHEKIVYEDNIDELYIQSKDGRLGILKNHVPVICALDVGVTKAVKDKESVQIATMGGILQFSNNSATILTDIAELDSDIDEARAIAAQKRAQARLEAQNETFDITRARLSLAKAMARLSAVNNKHF